MVKGDKLYEFEGLFLQQRRRIGFHERCTFVTSVSFCDIPYISSFSCSSGHRVTTFY